MGEDRFVVFIREDRRHYPSQPEVEERELTSCPTYEQARWVRQENTGPHRRCIIRYLGETGGGD
jgi:hypothetical protein